MAANSAIEWCDATFNPWIGCTKVSPACDHCYAERDFDLRLHAVKWGAGQARKRTSAANWKNPLRWNATPFCRCPECGWRGEEEEAMPVVGLLNVLEEWCPSCMKGAVQPARRRVFCASLADVFDNEVPAEWRAELFALIAATPNLDWLLLTKRIGNVASMIAAPGMQKCGLPPNVWLGATICNQDEADRDIPKLLATPAAVRFLSVEPMLGPVDLTDIVVRHGGGTEDHFSALYDADDDEADTASYIDWVICGGESGPHARPMHPHWARDLRDQCEVAGVPFMFKQWGEWLPGQNDIHPYANGRRVAHHQDGTWGVTATKVSTSNYVAWDESGLLHRGSLADAPPMFRIHAWAERVGKKAAGRLLDGRTHDGFPEVTP